MPPTATARGSVSLTRTAADVLATTATYVYATTTADVYATAAAASGRGLLQRWIRAPILPTRLATRKPQCTEPRVPSTAAAGDDGRALPI